MAEAAKLKTDGVRRGGNGDGGNSMASTIAKWGEYPKRGRDFLHEVRVEMRQVTWPTRHEVIVTTFVVIVAVAFFGAYFFGVDSTVGYVLQRLFTFFKAH